MSYLRDLLLFSVVLMSFNLAWAQWEMQDSHTTANLRGIHAVNGKVAWASGAEGTILRTEDRGLHWKKCAIPPDGEKLDFRGIWAWDSGTAVVMSAGPAEQSRLYKTTDGCAHWSEVARNTDKDGFWDAIAFQSLNSSSSAGVFAGVLIGDPVGGRFFTMAGSDKEWQMDKNACVAREGESVFAASNSSVVVFDPGKYVVGTGGRGGPRVLLSPLLADANSCAEAAVPVAGGNDSSGVFSLAFRDAKHGIAVGGDYKKPDDSSGTAAWTSDGGRHWTAASRPPHGYRSTVAWNRVAKAWIAAGTNGSDISRDDGKTWHTLDSGNWNALSLPYVVGPKGRIGKLTAAEIKQ
jgi:photosystem II stability/assembly factor-like uncharacterized protein